MLYDIILVFGIIHVILSYSYRVVGEYPAQQFFSLSPDGNVILIRDLRDNSLQNTEYKVHYTFRLILLVAIIGFIKHQQCHQHYDLFAHGSMLKNPSMKYR